MGYNSACKGLVFFFNYVKYPLNTAVRLTVKCMQIRIFLLLQVISEAFPVLRVYYTVAVRNSCSHHPYCQLHRAQSSRHYHAHRTVITSLSCTQHSHHFTIMHTAQSSHHYHAHSTVITSLSCTQHSHHFTIMHTAQSSRHYHAHSTVITSLSCTAACCPSQSASFKSFISTGPSVH
jgi:hypothetical protein